jgi:hypothetical protein
MGWKKRFATNKKATVHHNIGEQSYHILLDGDKYGVVSE